MKNITNYATSQVEDTAVGRATKSEAITFRLSANALEHIDSYRDTLHMTRTDVIEVLLMFAMKYVAHKKHERR